MRYAPLLSLAALLLTGAAPYDIVFQVNVPVGWACPQTEGYSHMAPGGSVICVLTPPNGWTGTVSLSGPGAPFFVLNGMTLQIGGHASYGAPPVTITATP